MSKCFSSDIFKEEIEQSTKAKDESFSQTITNSCYILNITKKCLIKTSGGAPVVA